MSTDTMSANESPEEYEGNEAAPASGPTVVEALQYADGLPADCWADRCIIALAAEVVRQREMNAEMHRTVAGYLEGAEWKHWQHYHAARLSPNTEMCRRSGGRGTNT